MPTAPVDVAPRAVTVQVQVKPTTVRRGNTLRLSVVATDSAHAKVIVHLKFHTGKPHAFHKKLSSAGKSAFKWRVSPSAPLGQGRIHVKVAVAGVQQPPAVKFTVVK